MSLRRTVKQQAKAALRGNRGTAAAMLLVVFAIIFCLRLLDAATLALLGYQFEFVWTDAFAYSGNFFYSLPALVVSLVSTLLWLILVAPLRYGLINWHLQLTHREKQGVSYLFWPYERKMGFRAVCLYLNIALRVTLFGVLLAVPAVGIYLLANTQPDLYYWTLMTMGDLWLLAALFFTMAFGKRYAMAGLLIGENYDMSAGDARRASVRYTKGHRWALVRLDLSFLPWAAPMLLLVGAALYSSYSYYDYFYYSGTLMLWWLAMTVGFVTLLAVQPYLFMSRVIYCRYLYEAATQKTAPEQTTMPGEEQPPSAPQPPATPSSVQWRDIQD